MKGSGSEGPIRVGVYHLLELDGITQEENRALQRIRMGISEEMQAVFDGHYQHLTYHLIAEVLVTDAEEAVRATSHIECNWVHNVEVERYYPTQLPPRSTRIGDVLKIGLHFLSISKLNEDVVSDVYFPSSVKPLVTVKQRRSFVTPASGSADHVWRPKQGEKQCST